MSENERRRRIAQRQRELSERKKEE
jgi:hypothetical protein